MEEIWKKIKGVENYEASSEGRIRKIINTSNHSTGYKTISIKFGNTVRQVLVHRLVGAAFLDLDLNDRKVFICHRDDDRKNNKLENLFVGDALLNAQDMVSKGRNVITSKLTQEEVCKIREKRILGFRISIIAKEFNVDKSTVSRICNGITW